MRLHDFLESQYVKHNIELQIEYTPAKQSYTHACQRIIAWQRNILRWIQIPVILFHYLLVELGIANIPLNQKELIKAYNDKAEAELLAKAKESSTQAAQASALEIVPKSPA